MYQKNKLRINIIIGLGVAMVLMIIIFLLFQSSLLNIDNFKVKGNENTPSEHIVEISGLRRGDKLFPLDSSATEKSIERLPWVENAEVQRSWAGTITFQVTERKPIAVAFSRSGYALLDKDGRVLEILGSEGGCESYADLFDGAVCIANLTVPAEAGLYVRQINQPIIDTAYQIQVLQKCLVAETAAGCPETFVTNFSSFIQQIVVHSRGEFEISLQLKGGGWVLVGNPMEGLESKLSTAFINITSGDENIEKNLCGDATLEVGLEGLTILTSVTNC